MKIESKMTMTAKFQKFTKSKYQKKVLKIN